MTTGTDALLPALPTDTEADQPCSSLELFASAVHPADRGNPDESLPRDLLIDIRWIGTLATATRAELRTAIPRELPDLSRQSRKILAENIFHSQ